MMSSARFGLLAASGLLLGLAAPAHATTGYSKATFDTCQSGRCSVPDTDLRPKALITSVIVNAYVQPYGIVNISLCTRTYNVFSADCDDATAIYFYNPSSQYIYKEFVIQPQNWSDPGSLAIKTPFFTYGGDAEFISWEVDY